MASSSGLLCNWGLSASTRFLAESHFGLCWESYSTPDFRWIGVRVLSWASRHSLEFTLGSLVCGGFFLKSLFSKGSWELLLEVCLEVRPSSEAIGSLKEEGCISTPLSSQPRISRILGGTSEQQAKSSRASSATPSKSAWLLLGWAAGAGPLIMAIAACWSPEGPDPSFLFMGIPFLWSGNRASDSGKSSSSSSHAF